MITIIADDKIPFLRGALDSYAVVKYLDGRAFTPSIVEHADALLIRTRTICNDALLHESKVKFIGTATIGFDHIDTVYCDAHSVSWVNAPGCNAASVQQYIASVLASLAIRYDFSLSGKTLGIIGVGHVGKKVEILARLLGMRVLLNDPPRARTEGESEFVSLEKLLGESDIVTLHVPLIKTGEDITRHLINESTLIRLKPGAWIINSSRGEVVDGNSLKAALSTGKLSGAVLDVWEDEPEIDVRLLEKVTFATPHIAGYSMEGKINGTVAVVRSLGLHFDLPVTQWKPSGIPEASNPVIILDCQEQPMEKLICRAILHTFDVAADDFRFRSAPGDFEIQRGSYPERREFSAYRIMLLKGNSEAKEIFRGLGFTVIDTQTADEAVNE